MLRGKHVPRAGAKFLQNVRAGKNMDPRTTKPVDPKPTSALADPPKRDTNLYSQAPVRHPNDICVDCLSHKKRIGDRCDGCHKLYLKQGRERERMGKASCTTCIYEVNSHCGYGPAPLAPCPGRCRMWIPR